MGEREQLHADLETKVFKAEHEAVMALHRAMEERRIDGDLQCWIDALQSLYAGEDVSVWECAKGGRGRVI